MPTAGYVDIEQIKAAFALIRTALNAPGRVPVDLEVQYDGCILDNAHKTKSKYQPFHIMLNGTRTYGYAHREVFRAKHGPASLDGNLEVDHMCRLTKCLNIGHLQAVSKRENIRLAAQDLRNDREILAQIYWIERNRCDASKLANAWKMSKPLAHGLIEGWRAKEAERTQLGQGKPLSAS